MAEGTDDVGRDLVYSNEDTCCIRRSYDVSEDHISDLRRKVEQVNLSHPLAVIAKTAVR